MSAPHVRVWGALAVVYVVWGSTYLGMAVLVERIPPLVGMGSRFVVSTVIVGVLIVALRGPRALVARPDQIARSAVIGVLLLTIGNGLVASAERYVPSGIAALLIASTPVWVVVLRRLTGDAPSRATVAGVVGGFVGVVGLVIAGNRAGDMGAGYRPASPTAVTAWTLAILVAALAWAVGPFMASRFARTDGLPKDPLTMTMWEFLAGGLVLMIIGTLSGERLPPVADWGTRAVSAWLYLVVAGILAFLAYTWLLTNARLSLAATYAYVNPVVAVILGWWIKDENLTVAIIVCGSVIVAGVALIVRGEQSDSTEAGTGETVNR